MTVPTLIYCAGHNREYAAIARAWFLLGARLPDLLYYPVEFADQKYKDPHRVEYMAALAEQRPRLATDLDWSTEEQFGEVMAWAEEAAQYVSEAVIIIPKVHGGIARLPRTVSGKQVRLGYSVPTAYGGTEVWVGEFTGWPVHLLGGGTNAQLRLARYLDVWSADGNYIHHKIKHGQYFDGVRWRQLRDGGYNVTGPHVPTTILRLSLPNLIDAWRRL